MFQVYFKSCRKMDQQVKIGTFLEALHDKGKKKKIHLCKISSFLATLKSKNGLKWKKYFEKNL